MASARTKSSGVVSLMFPASPSKPLTVIPAHSASAASSVKSVATLVRAPMCFKQGRKSKCLRRLYQPEGITIEGRFNGSVWLTRLTVSVTGSAGIAAPVCAAASIARAIRYALANGLAASWTSTNSGFRGSNASRPDRTDACRVARPKQARAHPCHQLASYEREVVRPYHGLYGETSREHPAKRTGRVGAGCRPRYDGIAWVNRRPPVRPDRPPLRWLRHAPFAAP